MPHPSSAPCPRDSRPGTYAVLLRPRHQGTVRIGRLGDLRLAGGVFIYVGSALGPGGVMARCRHHARIASRPHWHLDHLRPSCDLLGCWVAHGPERLEHRWALTLAELPAAHCPLPRFGASDCRCPAHLIGLPEAPEPDQLGLILPTGCWLGPSNVG
ncbi:MAG: GIY-YIG nuclease family protein [Sphingobacteriia bacterium]|nr:GIY-YIG nuclease family protein [Sphingobacteriia bacterium]NCC40176.1 GIY-YIG nuclease family protein [Gammaproteobacteria bacterium]